MRKIPPTHYMVYLMSYVTCLNNTYEWFIDWHVIGRRLGVKLCPFFCLTFVRMTQSWVLVDNSWICFGIIYVSDGHRFCMWRRNDQINFLLSFFFGFLFWIGECLQWIFRLKLVSFLSSVPLNFLPIKCMTMFYALLILLGHFLYLLNPNELIWI